MNKKDFWIALLAGLAAMVLWWQIAPRFFHTPPQQPTEQTAPPDAESPATTTQPDVPITQASGEHAPVTTTQSQPEVSAAAELKAFKPGDAQLNPDLTLGSVDRPDDRKASYFWMSATIDPAGASVARVELTDHYRTPARKEHYAVLGPELDAGLPAHALATEQVVIDGVKVSLNGDVWGVVSRSAVADGKEQSVTLATEIRSEAARILRIEKTWALAKDTFELQMRLTLVNDGGRERQVSVSSTGLPTLEQEGEQRDERMVFWGELAKDHQTATVKPKSRSDVIKESEKDLKLGGTHDETGLVWAASANRFFVAAIRPLDPRQSPADLTFYARRLGSDAAKDRFEICFTSSAMTLAAGKSETLAFSNFIGPKDRDLFSTVDAYKAMNYSELIQYGSCCCAGNLRWLVNVLLWLLDVLFLVVHNYGIAIMILVAVVRILLHPLTKKSQITMARMAKMGPKLEEIKKKYTDKSEQQKAMAEFYREQGFNPALGCLPMLLQMPIWIALWGGLNSAIELRHAPFFGWINDLSAPDGLWAWTTPDRAAHIPMLGPVYALNLLPILLMIAMFFQQLLTPKPTTGPQAKNQKFLMYFMTVFFGLIFYTLPSGLTLYVMASTAVGVGEQYVIRKHIREQEEAEARGEGPAGQRRAAAEKAKASRQPIRDRRRR
ncbi:MAG: Membrane protein insertase YidC [Phycisphaerae bacterium]|nr:Membrane protein insertase YidC [Phycisphaerae bacterium]